LKNLPLIAASISALLLASCANNPTPSDQAEVAGFTKIETVSKQGDEVVIPYSKYVLDNGLTVVLQMNNILV